ncbi:MAG: type II toxin-antitoxin system prevent-host-death family antitoxin [Rhodospirillales bacterium]|nr:type II toxin-antitoxin system prevent-host-death family antitoxin [Rhodospirillales bacterium]
MRTVSAAEANREFSKLLRVVRDGETVVVTSHGTPVATISPAERGLAERARGRQRLLERLRAQPAAEVGRWSRDELYDSP